RHAGDGVLQDSSHGARVDVVLQYSRGNRPAGGRARTHSQGAGLSPNRSPIVMDLKDLYRDVIVDHNRHPRNFGKLQPADVHADGHKPLCGVRLTVYANINGEHITDVKFEGTGCAISVASASLLTEAVKGKTKSEIKEL